MLTYVERAGSNCYKWDSEGAKGKLPLWVADMDFKAAPAILSAMQRRLDHGVFGYNVIPEEYFDAVSNWFSRRHGWHGIKREQLIPTIGVVPALSAVLRALSWRDRPWLNGGKMRVLTLTPAYNCFFSSVRNLEAELIESALVNNNGHYEIDWLDFEKKAEQSEVFIFCNPHNPTGRVWTRDEIVRIMGICEFYGVFVISDEIHCEITMPGHDYIPYASLMEPDDDYYCVLTSASKAFNIAGLQCACIFVPDKQMYAEIDRAINVHEVCDLNPFGVVATIAAYNESEEWLKELNAKICSNYQLLKSFLETHLKQLTLTEMEGTYLAWVGIKKTGMRAETFCQQLAEKQNVLFNPSEMYGCADYIRINLATSETILEEALKRLQNFVENEVCC